MRLTIIIPTCNNEATIRQLLISMRVKEHYRILCIDGGSTNKTILMIERLRETQAYFINKSSKCFDSYVLIKV